MHERKMAINRKDGIRKFSGLSVGLMLVLLFLSFSAVAQNIALIDSIRKQFATASPAKRYNLLNTIGFEYRYSYPDSTIAYCNKAYALGKALHLTKDLSRPLSFIGLASANKGDFTQSVKYHYEAIDVAIQQNDSVQLAFGYNNLGRMFFDEGDLGRAYTNLIRSKELFEILKNKSGLAYVFRSMANIYKSQRDFGQALEMSDRAYELRRQAGEPRGIVSALVELGLVYEDMNNGEKALEKFKMADSLVARIHDKITQAEVKMGMAEVLFHHKKYEESLRNANSVLAVVTNQTNQKLFLRASLIRANYFYQQKNYDRAIPILEKIADESENNLSFKRDAYFLLSEIYGVKKNTSRLQQYSTGYTILNEKLRNTNLTLQVNQLQFKLDLEKIEKENDLLKANQTKDLALISTQRIQNILLLITVVSVSVIVLLLWLDGRRRRRIQHQLELKSIQILQQGNEIEIKNKDLHQRNVELSDLNYEKDTLMNIVAHDLKSPINNILGITRLFQMESNLTPQQKEYLSMIQRATNSGLDLIVDLLDVSALQEMKEKPTPAAFDWNGLVEERVKSFEPAAKAKGITLIINSAPPTATIISERGYINRIFDNLISNAIKFSQPGTSVQLSTELGNNQVKIRIKDQGPGFTEEDKQFLFQRFKKLSARPTAGESSNGLGLTIVKTLVDRLEGEIQLISTTSHGSEFIVSIPVKIAEKSAL